MSDCIFYDSSFKIDSLREINGRSQFVEMKIQENSLIDKKVKKIINEEKEKSTAHK